MFYKNVHDPTDRPSVDNKVEREKERERRDDRLGVVSNPFRTWRSRRVIAGDTPEMILR